MDPDQNLLKLTADIVSAMLIKTEMPAALLPETITKVYQALATVDQPVAEPVKHEPRVNPRKSVFPSYIISLEDGSKHTMLKRHLKVKYGLTPDQYREKWGLPKDYPMTAPKYTTRRSEIARATGLGRKADRQTEPELDFEDKPDLVRIPDPEPEKITFLPAGKSGIKRGRKAAAKPVTEAADQAEAVE